MKLRKIFAAAAATVVASVMAVSANAASALTAIQPNQAILGFGDSEWKASGWGKDENALDLSYFKLADVTGDGTYTVGIDLSAGYENLGGIEDENTGELVVYNTAAGIGAMGVNLNVDADNEAYDNVCINIISVKFDGVETKIDGAVSYTNNEDGAKRSNVMNQWANYDSTKEDHITVDPAAATSVLTNFADEWTTCEVTFEVTGMPAAAGSTEAGKGSSDTGVEGIAAVAGVAIVAAGAVLVSKKRK